ncbi:hypothetical protein Q765_01000 [Flavobacterium rivuli WB 3.3-2 = DSM 21788]|uniref:Uncharacterized protein n=1 Tax=Flavobacterium rivuli WB 3.3-2 = DSM 21788 TaxID=1121895 RepID=A0A0A2MJL3_9FLAO|nr:hypothetical protein Q765_01000 [Flavobacterium rivuli WB 3.3-2 = DSM 21788]
MEYVNSKKNFIRFCFGLTGFFVLFFSLGSLLIITGLRQYNQIPKPPKTDLMIVLGSFSILFVSYFIYSYVKNSPKIFIDRKTIRFNNKQYLTNSIKEISFSGKHSFTLSKVEGIKIQFKNGEVRYIFNLLYDNYYC